jgi:hypothetical protein
VPGRETGMRRARFHLIPGIEPARACLVERGMPSGEV